jgi:hypothetical protein
MLACGELSPVRPSDVVAVGWFWLVEFLMCVLFVGEGSPFFPRFGVPMVAWQHGLGGAGWRSRFTSGGTSCARVFCRSLGLESGYGGGFRCRS